MIFACRDYAQYSLGPGSEKAASDAAAANAVGGAALGAAAGAIIGAASGHAGPGAAIGAGTGLLFGSAAGANSAGYSSYGMQRRDHAAYLQCMYAKGTRCRGACMRRGTDRRPVRDRLRTDLRTARRQTTCRWAPPAS